MPVVIEPVSGEQVRAAFAGFATKLVVSRHVNDQLRGRPWTAQMGALQWLSGPRCGGRTGHLPSLPHALGQVLESYPIPQDAWPGQ